MTIVIECTQRPDCKHFSWPTCTTHSQQIQLEKKKIRNLPHRNITDQSFFLCWLIIRTTHKHTHTQTALRIIHHYSYMVFRHGLWLYLLPDYNTFSLCPVRSFTFTPVVLIPSVSLSWLNNIPKHLILCIINAVSNTKTCCSRVIESISTGSHVTKQKKEIAYTINCSLMILLALHFRFSSITF